ncbi:MAG: 4-hydroxy-3-methylbut-2-enyl diphosphate reductase [Actinobacteria bacterium]|nr:4-hydroxy-3-methylbut-2-enyl diphosphate reductase [Actinomycetota bacterium]
MNVNKVYLAKPRGFCAGVEMAIKSLTWMVRVFESPVYCYHEIVHNRVVVDRFEQLGVIFVNDISEVPPGAPVMLSAHGSAPEIVESVRETAGINVNAVCPLVTKVHHEVKVRSKKGYSIVYVGHKGHDEAIGTMAVAPESVKLVETEADLEQLQIDDSLVALLTQTTLSIDEWAGVKQAAEMKFPNIWMPNRSDLCFATTNRQMAIREIASLSEIVIVIGSANSSNTVALEKTAKRYGAKRVYRINHPDELPTNLEGIVGVTAGASAPEDLVKSVIDRMSPLDGVEEVNVTFEEEYFPPPPELRDLLRTISDLVSLSLVAPSCKDYPVDNDRNVKASDILEGLTAKS